MKQDTIIVYTYKYVWEKKDGNLCVKYMTETQENHAKFQQIIHDDKEIVACYREYISEVNFAYLNFTESVKEKEKKEKE